MLGSDGFDAPAAASYAAAMARNSLILGLLSLLLAFLGFLAFASPVIGTLLRFAAPSLGLAGIIYGGMALRRTGDGGDSNGAALALGGLATSILGFLVGLIVLVACSAGACAASAAGDVLEAAQAAETQSQ